MFNDKMLLNVRGAHGGVSFREKVSATAEGCVRASAVFVSPKYRTIKAIHD